MSGLTGPVRRATLYVRNVKSRRSDKKVASYAVGLRPDPNHEYYVTKSGDTSTFAEKAWVSDASTALDRVKAFVDKNTNISVSVSIMDD